MAVQEYRNSLTRMHAQLNTWELAKDRRSIFLSCYSLMTNNMLAAIQQNRFRDNVWVHRWLNHFSDFYFAALEAYEKKAPNLPLPWRMAFDATKDPNTFILQNLLLGINAHINFDLIIALINMLENEWGSISAEQMESRFQDFCTVNEIIAGTIDLAEDKLLRPYIPLFGLADDLLGPIDEWMTANLITRWRDRVWNLTVQYLNTRDINKQQEQITYFEVSATAQARAFLLSDLTDHFTDLL